MVSGQHNLAPYLLKKHKAKESVMDNEDLAPGHLEDTERKKSSMSVKIGSGEWYVIPPTMADAFRKAGATVCETDEIIGPPLPT
jgi:hypothetical protein